MITEDVFIAKRSYPDLKTSATFSQAMTAYTDSKEYTAAARRFYHTAINELKNKVEIFQSSAIASALSIKHDMPFFEASAIEKQSVNAADFL